MKKKWVDMYLQFAIEAAKRSHAKRLQVGAIFVSVNGIVSTGINGMPEGDTNECEIKEYMDPTAGGWLDPETIAIQWPYTESELSVTGAQRRYKLTTKPEVSHAEENLFAKIMQQGISTIGGRIFLTHSPCIHCAKIIVRSKVTHVHYLEDFKSDDGVKWLVKNKVIVIKEK